MNILDSVFTQTPKAPRILIYGAQGIGKSTLASKFPNPLFMLTEETGLVGVKALPMFHKLSDFIRAIEGLLQVENFPYQTIVVDTLTALDALIVNKIIDDELSTTNKTKATLASSCGGYGAGYERAANIHRSIKALFNKFQEKGVTVVFIGHATVKHYSPPDSDTYDIYTIASSHDKCRSVYIDDCDAVLFCKMQCMVNENSSGRNVVRTTNQHVIMTSVNPVNISKNRFGMPAEIPMNVEEIKKHIPFYRGEKSE